ncbi:hypothetical protein ACFE04_012940 [Oxalis oulophora]
MAVPIPAPAPVNDDDGSGGGVWETVLNTTKFYQKQKTNPSIWATELSKILNSFGVTQPSSEFAHLLVSHIFWDNHCSITWKFLEMAIVHNLAPPMLVLALLSNRVISKRKIHPSGYRLYMELLKRHPFTFASVFKERNYEEIMKSTDDVLSLSQIFGIQASEPGIFVVEFVFASIWQLLDASLDDEGLLGLTVEKESRWPTEPQDMEIDGQDSFPQRRIENIEKMRKLNTAIAVEIIGEVLQNETTSRVLFLACHNMESHWKGFVQRLRLLAANSSLLTSSKNINPDKLLQLTPKTPVVLSGKPKMTSEEKFIEVMASGALLSSAGECRGTSHSALWLPIDLFFEDAMDGAQVRPNSAVEDLTRLVKALQAVNRTSWEGTFLGLWIAALRLVQRERDPCEGPVPRLDTALCMLLSITVLAIAEIIKEEETSFPVKSVTNQKEKRAMGKCREGLITSMQLLGDFESLLIPPEPVRLAANQAAARAIMFDSANGYYEGMGVDDMQMNSSGNMRHLIVEACIARALLDTSAYNWPGYKISSDNKDPCSIPCQMHSWASLEKGSSLTPSMIEDLVKTPASSLRELKKIYEIAVNGSDDDKIAAASILCGASLVRGWSIQELTIYFILKLLEQPVPADNLGSENHLIKHARFLNVLIVGISPVDCVQCISLHGLVPVLVGVLLPICETFGSCVPDTLWTLSEQEKFDSHSIFTNAFTLLVRLYRFDLPPLEHVMGDVAPVGSLLCPEYLLLVRNSLLASWGTLPKDHIASVLNFSQEPIFMDSYPKLKRWYRQHQDCIASPLSGLVQGTAIHEIVDSLLLIMFKKIKGEGGNPLSSTSSGSSSVPLGSGVEDVRSRLKIPAWCILEATPFVLDAALTACAQGRLSSRELATGLKVLADFLPATLATIVSYFAAESSRGVWKEASMNGSDWPNPGDNLSTVEKQIKKILDATGVIVPSLTIGGCSVATLPLAMAALISLTITFKIHSSTDSLLALIGPALSSLAASCPWPCMPILASLWTQKAKRWSDFLVFSASSTVFHHDSDALVQLLKSCFLSALSLGPSNIYSNGSVGALLGHGFGSHIVGGISPAAPGLLYLRVYRSVRSIIFLAEEILSLLANSVRDFATKENLGKPKAAKFALKSGNISLATAMTQVKLAASLGASLAWISGGSNLIESLIKETLPSWLISVREYGGATSTVNMLVGYSIAYFVMLCGTFAWGVDLSLLESKKSPKVLGVHFEFLASALNRKISLGCDRETWRAYVSGFVTLIVTCVPKWVGVIDPDVLKRLSEGLTQHDLEDLALALLSAGGVGTMGAASELIIRSWSHSVTDNDE